LFAAKVFLLSIVSAFFLTHAHAAYYEINLDKNLFGKLGLSSVSQAQYGSGSGPAESVFQPMMNPVY
jgi:hypothetical protein